METRTLPGPFAIDLNLERPAQERTDEHKKSKHANAREGWLDGDCIECPLHAGRFEVRTGKALGPPVDEDIKVYPVRIVGNDVQVKPG